MQAIRRYFWQMGWITTSTSNCQCSINNEKNALSHTPFPYKIQIEWPNGQKNNINENENERINNNNHSLN